MGGETIEDDRCLALGSGRDRGLCGAGFGGGESVCCRIDAIVLGRDTPEGLQEVANLGHGLHPCVITVSWPLFDDGGRRYIRYEGDRGPRRGIVAVDVQGNQRGAAVNRAVHGSARLIFVRGVEDPGDRSLSVTAALGPPVTQSGEVAGHRVGVVVGHGGSVVSRRQGQPATSPTIE